MDRENNKSEKPEADPKLRMIRIETIEKMADKEKPKNKKE
jgi:hypothetical protein